MTKGIDVSYANGNVDWKKVKADGVDFAIIRAGFGRFTVQEDTEFKRNIEGAAAAGVKIGIYWFGYAYTDKMAEEEAIACNEVIKKYKDKISLPVFYDWEYDSYNYAKNHGGVLNKKNITSWTVKFLEKIKSFGWTPGVYMNLDYYRTKYEVEKLKNYKLWMAIWGNEEYKDCMIHQYSDAGSVKGINGRVDMNHLYENFAIEVNPEPVPEPTPKPTPTNVKVNATYRVRAKGRWLPEVVDLKDYAGNIGEEITDVAIKVNKGKVKYRVHTQGRWLPYVNGYDITDSVNGYAGNGTPVDAVEVYYGTPGTILPYKQATYRVSPVRKGYYDWQIDDSTKNGMDGYAGVFGKTIDRFQLEIKEN